jgi:hypothetical protein
MMENYVRVALNTPEDFLKVKETLTRIGIANVKTKTLYQSCHILHKQSKYYIMHFKEMFELDGKESSLTSQDIQRRNTIAGLLNQWKLINVCEPKQIMNQIDISQIKVIPFRYKHEWDLVSKYTVGKRVD